MQIDKGHASFLVIEESLIWKDIGATLQMRARTFYLHFTSIFAYKTKKEKNLNLLSSKKVVLPLFFA
jgi:hypothetical protein